MTESRDYVSRGLARWPEATRGPNVTSYLSVYLQELVDNEDTVWEVLDGLREWNVQDVSTQASFVLDTVGRLLGQPRPSGFSDVDYKFILRVRSIVRMSDATKPAVFRVCNALSQGQPFMLLEQVPEHWTVSFSLVLDAQWQELYRRLLYDAIGATDSLDLYFAVPGTALYDDPEVGYDEGAYS